MTISPTCHEKSSMRLRLAFLDDDDLAVIPTAATYKIDAPDQNRAILAVTSITGLTATKDLIITKAQNTMTAPNLDYERRVVTVEFDYGDEGGHGTDEYTYYLQNLSGL